MSNITKDQVIEWLSSQSVLEISGLVKDLESKWGVSAAAPVAAAAAPAAAAAAAAPAEEKTEFTVVLLEGGANKIGAIKEVRAITGLGLKEAKDLVEGAPKPVKEGVYKAEGRGDQEEARGRRRQSGAQVIWAIAWRSPPYSIIQFTGQAAQARGLSFAFFSIRTICLQIRGPLSRTAL